MIFAIPIELKVREFTSKVYLSYKILQNTNIDVVIGKKNVIYNFFKKNKNVFLLLKGGVRANFPFTKKHLKGNKIALLDEEGPLFNVGEYDKKTRYSKFMINNSDFILLWGKKDLDVSRSFVETLGKKTFITGHPKYDLLKKPTVEYFNKEVISIKKKYKKYVLISSNFNGGDSVNEKEINNKYYQNTLTLSEKRKNDNFLLKTEKADLENYTKIINIIINLAKKNKKTNFIFRPHPRQNVKKVKKRFPKNIKNIKVIYEHSITPWIYGSEIFIHSGCTSSFEANILKKKIIYFVANNFPKRPETYKKFGKYFNNQIYCEKYINELITNKKKHKFKKLNSNIIENYEDKVFYKILFKIFKKYKIDDKGKTNLYFDDFNKKKFKLLKNFLSVIKNFMLENKIGVSLINKIDPNLLLSKNYKEKKYTLIKKSEIVNSLNLFRKTDLIKKKYKVIDIKNDCFYLTTKKKLNIIKII